MGKDVENERDNVSLLDSILDQFGITKLTQGREKAFTQAFYNSVALILMIVCTIAVWGVVIILQPFIKPLLWAVLCGSVLHPFKFHLSSSFKKWLCNLEHSKKPLSIEIASVPIFILINLSELVGSIVISKFTAVTFVLFLFSYGISVLYEYTPPFVISLLRQLYLLLVYVLLNFLNIFQSTASVTAVLGSFLIAITFLWDEKKPLIFHIASYATWFGIACYVTNFFDYLRLPVFLFLMTMSIFGIIYEVWCDQKGPTLEKETPVRKFSPIGCSTTYEEEKKNRAFIKTTKSEGDVSSSHVSAPKFEFSSLTTPIKSPAFQAVKENLLTEITSSNEEPVVNEESDWTDISKLLQNPHTSDLYIYSVAFCCAIIVIVKNLWLLYIIAFLFIIHVAKLGCTVFGVWLLVQEFWERLMNQLEVWYACRSNVLIPRPVAAFFKVMDVIKCQVLRGLQQYSDAAASVAVILGLLALLVVMSTFLCIQMYTEGFYMVKVSGQIINQTVVHNPELMQMLPEGWEDQLDSALNSAYTYGRELLTKTLRKVLKDIPGDKAEELTRTALELWDRVYQAWVMTSLEQSIGPKVTSTAVFQTWSQFLNGVQKTPGLINFNSLKSLLLENMASLSSGLESIWLIVKGNASLLLHGVTTSFSVVIGHGAALFSFFINIIVFLTALFYLLSSSRVLYKPVEILTNMIPQYGNKLAVAMETAAKEVLLASFKLTIFYGLWTWFIHNLFIMNIVYIPAVLAAILAVVPVLGTYWACLPGVLDLWLAQGKGFHALALAICQFLPTTIVDTTIYNDIHGGHPYLTGLAVAGGVLCLGSEGAIIGPLALCGLFVITNLSSGLLKESAPSPSPSTISTTSPA